MKVILLSFLMIWSMMSSAVAQEISSLQNHDTAQPIDISADRLEVRQREDIVVFIGSVVAEQGDMTFSADRVTVYYLPGENATNPTISRLDAEGTVSLISSSESATGDWGVYDVVNRLVTLGGHVQLTRGDTTISGDRLELDLVSGVTRFDGGVNRSSGRVEGRFRLPENETEDSETDDETDNF